MDSLEKNEMIRVARHTRTVIRLSAGLLVLIFAWLKLNNEEVGKALAGSSPEFLLRVSLTLYFVSWVAGTTNDTNEQELAYTAPPATPATKRNTYLAAVSIVGIFGVLCWVRSARMFAVTLAIFLVANVIWWRILVKRVLDAPIANSKQRALDSRDNYALAIIENFEDYIAGRWQWLRFLVGGLMVALMLYVAYIGLPDPIATSMPAYARDGVLGALLLLYVLIIEAWIWLRRLQVAHTRSALEKLSRVYRLESLADDLPRAEESEA